MSPYLQYLKTVSSMDSSKGSGLYWLTSCVSHSCQPNSKLMFHNINSTLTLVALNNVEEGDEISLCFINPQAPFDERRIWLKIQYQITCQCVRCTNEMTPHSMQISELIKNHLESNQNKLKVGTSESSTDLHIREQIEERDLDRVLTLTANLLVNPFKQFSDKKQFIQKQILLPGVCSLLASLKKQENELGFSIEAKQSRLQGAGFGAFLKGNQHQRIWMLITKWNGRQSQKRFSGLHLWRNFAVYFGS